MPCPSRAAALLLAAACAAPAHAAHPLQTEDTGTQGEGNFEWENGLSHTRSAAGRVLLYQPQFSLGLSPTVDAILQPSWLDSRGAGSTTARGQGDTNLDAKWRFYGAAPWSLAVRAGLQLPTSQHGLGLPHGHIASHALLVLTADAAPFTWHANLGVAHNPAGSGLRREVPLLSGAVMWARSESLILTLDSQLSGSDDPARGRPNASVLAGTIWTLWPGLDLDVGYQTRVGPNPLSRQWLAGVTYRFSL
jgi:hypothetical protein